MKILLVPIDLENVQGLPMLEKYLEMEGLREKSLKVKSVLNSRTLVKNA